MTLSNLTFGGAALLALSVAAGAAAQEKNSEPKPAPKSESPKAESPKAESSKAETPKAEAKPSGGEKKEGKLDQAALEKKFSERMANVALVGRFTTDGQADKPATEERYEIESVTKARDDYWTFLARIKYGKTDLKVPITVKVLWAGDTPMVSLTDFTIPGMGTFTSRVLFYDDRYAGTWQHGPVGGHMFGRIEKAKPDDKPEKSDKPGKTDKEKTEKPAEKP